MPKTEIKSRLREHYFGIYDNGSRGFSSKECPQGKPLYLSELVFCVSMDYMSDGDFWVRYTTIKSREKDFKKTTKKFYSGIDAWVCYEGFLSEFNNKFYKTIN